VSLKKYYNGSWVLLDSEFTGPIPGPGTLRATARYSCKNVPERPYATVSDAYSVVGGVWYAGSVTKKDHITCP
jgi:hypothetical protein